MADSEQIVIGRSRLRSQPGPIWIEATAEIESELGTAWLMRTDPGPRQAIGYTSTAAPKRLIAAAAHAYRRRPDAP